ncbi:GNAT family N-acetyltransferase [Luteibacter sp. PPL201]|uniref:GNAT family N-acetyltransferase n=1 Tax=Luteibacter sahnii TaxID=3021977 RepID=A0ABT6B9U3_9GAMM
MDATYSLVPGVPSVDDYLRLRRASGLTPRSAEAAHAGLPRTVVGVIVRHGETVVGMGRVVGDGLFYLLVDIAVDPAHQKKGIGKALVGRLMDELGKVSPAEAYVGLFADGEACHLYAKFGFEPTAPASLGMARWIGSRVGSVRS